MSKLTDRISYLQGLAAGMKLNPEKDSHKLILEILDVLGDVGDAFDALADSHGELSDYVESIDEDLSDLEDILYQDEEDDEDWDDEEDDEDEDDEDGEDDDEEASDVIQYECPHCHQVIELDPEEVDLEEENLCPVCGKELFPELPGEEN